MNELESYRLVLDEIDNSMRTLFLQRQEIVTLIGQYKKLHNLPIYDLIREQKMKENLSKDLTNSQKTDYLLFLENILLISKERQK